MTLSGMNAPVNDLSANDSEDPFRWLEDVTGNQPLDWVRQQNDETTRELRDILGFGELEQRLLKILDSTERIPMISKEGHFYYNFWRDANNRRGLWRRTTLNEYRKPQPQWEIVVDLDQLAASEKENWVWKDVNFLEPSFDRCLISLSRGGADATVIREFDLTTKEFVRDGFVLAEAKSRVAWRTKDSVFVGTNMGEGTLTKSGYPRTVRQWQRGTELPLAPVIFEGNVEDVSVSGGREPARGFERDLIHRAVTFWTSELRVRHRDELVLVQKPMDANAFVHRGRLFFELRSSATIGERTFPAGALLATNLDNYLEGQRDLAVLYHPEPHKSLAGFSVTRNHVIVNELDNVRNRIFVLTPSADGWKRGALVGAPEYSTVNVSAVDSEESDDYFMVVSDYLSPTTLYLGTIGKGPPEKLKQNPTFFNSDGLEVQQNTAISKDGTRVPYFQVSRQGLRHNGATPTLLYGYGGFEISMLPGYQAATGAAWLEKGGIYVVANIRGGGEFGPRWHQAALKENRHRAYEDFAAVAQDLIDRQVTSPKHLGAMGGSNGGLLMGNMLTRRSDLFGAIVCQVPLLDMKRYHLLLAGASWVAEYGNPDVSAEWEYIQTFSPYHNVKSDGKYPPVLFTTSTRDDRVHPGHARKMVARMLEQGHTVSYFENIEGGHGGSADNKQAAFMSALAYTFLWKNLAAKPGTE